MIVKSYKCKKQKSMNEYGSLILIIQEIFMKELPEHCQNFESRICQYLIQSSR